MCWGPRLPYKEGAVLGVASAFVLKLDVKRVTFSTVDSSGGVLSHSFASVHMMLMHLADIHCIHVHAHLSASAA